MATYRETTPRHPLDNLWTDFCVWVDSTEGQMRKKKADRLDAANRRLNTVEARDEHRERELSAVG